MRRTNRSLLLVAAAALCARTGSGQSIAVGWASTSITPDKPVALQGQMYTRISQSVHDPVTATALAIEGGGDQAIMVSCDIVGIDGGLQRAVREKLKGKLPGFDLRKLLLNATHTHTAPALTEGQYEIPSEAMRPGEYFSFLVDRVAEAVVRAWQNRQPGGVSWAYGHAVVGHNRRAVYESGRAQMYGKTDRQDFTHVEGPDDHGLDLLFFWNASGRLTGVLIDVPCPSQLLEKESYISADFWGEVRKELRKRYSGDLFVYPITGAAGDQSPHYLFGERAEIKMRERRGFTETEEVAQRIANAVDIAMPGARKDVRTEVVLRHAVEDLQVPFHPITEKQFGAARDQYEKNANSAPETNRNRQYVMRFEKAIMDRYESQAKGTNYYKAEIHVLRIGDVAIATSPFELFVDYGIRIKVRSPAEQVFLVQLACGYGLYLPTARAVQAGGYSAELASFRVGPQGGQMLVDRTLALMNSLWPK